MARESDLLARCASVIQRYPTGMMTTVEPTGMPCSRYMTAAIGANIRQLYCLTVRDGRKLAHLHANPEVCWVFADPEQQEVVTLYGHAREVDDAVGADDLWDRLIRHVEPYGLNMLGQQEGTEYRFVETRVDAVEYLNQQEKILRPHRVQLHQPGRSAGCCGGAGCSSA
ncbi:pyridoxamine 5'-phosphate oxidase family protein [Phycisphaerales bacterium AB-hyl4]|uniref:Pyridoxamine 5'-phosphate oxidase family protein n=1 Tax=Natronomicrosphaera hydrolytica TaxID=3242702 RepID=A0ABV4UBJ7_9BACT